MPRRLFAGFALVLASLPAVAQDARLSRTQPRVLFAVSDSVKTDDGRYARLTTTLRFDPLAGEYVQSVVDASGRVLSRDVRRASVAGPTAGEAAESEALIVGHPEIAALLDAAEHPVRIEGGFPLVHEDGPCGPGSRCLSYDVIEVAPGDRPPRRLRYVVVDLRTLRVADADADPVDDGNLAHPAARRQSRSW